jgi:hypothetical protein
VLNLSAGSLHWAVAEIQSLSDDFSDSPKIPNDIVFAHSHTSSLEVGMSSTCPR